MRSTVRYAGAFAILAIAAVLGGCASTTRQLSPQSAQVQPQALTAAVSNAAINVASPDTPFPQNKQNEPAVAIDPNHPDILAAGSNDEIDLQPCTNDASVGCPFTPGVGVSGIYFSTDGGATWTQPTYVNGGLTGAGCTPADTSCDAVTGDIHTLPNYADAGLVADGDPALAFGPVPGSDGTFSWSNGSRLYYGNLTSNVSAARSEAAFKGFEAIAVSYTDDVAAAASGDATAWSSPVIVSKQNAALFSDKDALWVDNNANSPYFGHVYMCNVAFRSQEMSPYAVPEPVIFSRSGDGGDTWTNQQISSAANNLIGQGRQGCAVRTDSQGTVYVFFESAGHKKSTPPVASSAILMARSTDGGQTFSRPTPIADVTDCGTYDGIGVEFDGIAGARTDSFPSVDIANGAPDATNASDAIAVTWCDAGQGVNNEQALVTLSTDGGKHWTAPVNAADTADRPDFPSVAISPDGANVYLTYMGFLDPYRDNTTDARRMQGVVRHATLDSGELSAFTTLHRGAVGDARASSANSLAVEFLGDYTYTAASNDGAIGVWTAVNGDVCSAVNAYRASIFTASPETRPLPQQDCASGSPAASTFGDTDIASFATPTP